MDVRYYFESFGSAIKSFQIVLGLTPTDIGEGRLASVVGHGKNKI